MAAPVAHLPVPSQYFWRSQAPGPQLMDQWRGVYHATALPNHLRWQLLMSRKRAAVAEKARFSGVLKDLWAVEAELCRAKTGPFRPRWEHLLRLNEHGLVAAGMGHFDQLLGQRALTAAHCTQVIQSLTARAEQDHIMKVEASYDAGLARRLMGDRQASTRLNEGERVFDSVADQHRTIHQHNALMQLALTCGYPSAARVAGAMYDAVGAARLQPTVHTYELVMDSLMMQANVDEAAAVLKWLQCHHPDALTVEVYNTMMRGLRLNRMFDRMDEMWRAMIDSGRPGPNIETAEIYLRSIVDLTYTPTSSPLNFYGNVHNVEKKRIPLVLVEMEKLGIPVAQLSPPLTAEVEDALRKFVVRREEFYRLGRAVKLFSFADYRRKMGWVSDIAEHSPTVLSAPQVAPVGDDGTVAKFTAPIGTLDLPTEFTQKDPWERPALQQALSVSWLKEHMQDTRQAPKFALEQTPIHKRAASWRLDSPQTRYDPLLAQSSFDANRIGVRRHLWREHPNQAEVLARDADIIASSLKSARRVRVKVDLHRTHRQGSE